MRNQTTALMAFALALGISLPMAAQTQSSSPTTQPSTPSQAPTAGAGSAPSQAAPEQTQGAPAATTQQRDPVADALNLTDDQQAKLQPIIREEMTQINAARNDTSLTQEQKQQKIDQIRQTEFPKIQAILTPEQQKKLADMQEQARRGQGSTNASPNNAPPPPQK
jgi:Spy/CpxP family protein refolding chaperone